MDDSVQPNLSLGLSADLIKEIFPIAPSDRRKHKVVFSSAISEEHLMDDPAFYEGLLSVVASGTYAPLRLYDDRMLSSRKGNKTFGSRALRWLVRRSAGDLSLDDMPGLARDHFPPGTPERVVHLLLLGLFDQDDSQASEPSTEPPDAAEEPLELAEPETQDWAALAVAIAEAAKGLDKPDPDAAERIVLLAQELVASCRDAARAAAERQVVEVRAAALRQRLESLPSGIAGMWPTHTPTPAWLDRLEEALADVEFAEREFAEADRVLQAADAEIRAVIDARDYGRVGEFSAKAKLASEHVQSSQNLQERAREALLEILQPRGVTAIPVEVTEPSRTSSELDLDAKATPMFAEQERARQSELDPGPAVAVPENMGPSAAHPPSRQSDEADASGGVAIDAISESATGYTSLQVPQREPSATLAVSHHSAITADTAALLAHYLERDEPAFAWHLARLVPSPVPPPVLLALTILPAIQRAEDMADPRRNNALAELASSLPESNDQVAAGRLALAALARPALFDPDHGARQHVENLLGFPGLEAQAPLIEALAGLGYDVRLSAALLAELAGTRAPPAEPAARERLGKWLTEARRRKTVHQPTHALFHRELQREGALGQIVEAVITGAPGAEAMAQQQVDSLSHNRAAQELLVAEAERQSGRPKRDRIEGMALDWFCRGIQESCDHLLEWLEACRDDAAHTQDQNRERLLRVLGPVRKALDLSVVGSNVDDSAVANAAGHMLASKLEDLRSLIEGRTSGLPTPRSRELLDAPLLRLPGGCQRWADVDDPAFAAEREAQNVRLTAALMRPDCIPSDEVAAFEARLSEPALLSAQLLLDRLRDRADETSFSRDLQQRLDEAMDAARRGFRERLGRLRQSMTTIGYLDLDSATTLPGDLARLAVIDAALFPPPGASGPMLPALNGLRTADVPPDFPELDALLSEMESRRNKLRARIGDRQRVELERLTSGSEGDSARALLAVFNRLDPVTVDDAIAELNAGRAVPMPDADTPDVFARFFPGFVAALAANPEDTARGRVLSALRNGGAAGPLELGKIDERHAKRLSQLLESWGAAENAMRQSQPARLREALSQLFGLIGFNGLRLTESREAVPGRLRLLTLNCDVPPASNWFLPPAFGSAAGGRYPLMVARADVPLDQLLRQIGSEAPDAPWFVVVFGRLDVQERARLARQMRAEARTALLLDETLLLFSGLESDDPFCTFLTCALPFAWVQPYTTSAGQIPPEIFFGRRAEIDRIVARDGGGCLIYGGRQLGKSVLLNHIRGERHRPERGELALCLDIKPIGGPGQPAEHIWQELAHRLALLPAFERLEAQPNAVVTRIETWLGQDPARRVLAMFDEADNFLRAEHESGYPNLQPLKGLAERTGQRFKAVFAGLHNVRRMARAPNSPLPHLGAPVCIGPMNQSPENRAALRSLSVEPMRAAGLEYSDPGLVSDMLARINYYPSLVQVFGRQIVESFGRRPRVTGEGPRWRLDRDSLFEGAAAERIAEQIRDRFQLTLNLDVRYDCIARSIALHRLESAGGDVKVLAQGLTASEIRRVTHWPKVLVEPAMTDFEELLSELVDLGVLSEFPDRRYGLRNAQVAQMLGGREALEEALLRLDEREDDPAYDAALFFRSLRPEMPEARAPLSDRELERLFDGAIPGLRSVRWNPAIVGTDVANRILVAAKLWLPDGKHTKTKADTGQIRRALDKANVGPTALVIDGDWSESMAMQLATNAKVTKGEVLPVWCHQGFFGRMEGAIAFDARPWSEAMLRHWLADEGLAPALDETRTRAALLAVSGGAPARLAALRSLLGELSVRPISERVEQLHDWGRKSSVPPSALGIDERDLSCLAIVRGLEDQDPSRQDLLDFCPDATDERLEKLMTLGMLRQGRVPETAPILTPLGRLTTE